MAKHLRFDIRNAYEEGIIEHPQYAMIRLGIVYQHATPQSIVDEWWFWNCENVPDELPTFLRIAEFNPMEYIGYGLSKENAEKIRDYEKN